MNEWEWRLLEERTTVDRVSHAGGELRAGSRVKLRPRPRGDVMDLLLAGKTAVIEAIEQDYEGAVHLALVFDEDPGRDLGLLRQPGHRFFYAPEEVELVPDEGVDSASGGAAGPAVPVSSILIAGIGNIFLGDDGFGVEVARRLSTSELPAGVRVVDYGIRGLDLAYALADLPDVTILVDACQRGEAPGTLFVIEPDLEFQGAPDPPAMDAHSLDPIRVIRMARSMGERLNRIVLVGCEPATFGPEEGQLGLSEQIEAAVDEAVKLVLDLVQETRGGGPVAGEWQITASEGRRSE
jgi:hydrogenase maturation protease